MGDTDVAPGHKQIVHVTRIQTTIRHGIRMDQDMLRHGLKLVAGEMLTVFGVLPMQIDTPCRGERGIFMGYVFGDIILFQDIITHQATRFTLAGDISDPT